MCKVSTETRVGGDPVRCTVFPRVILRHCRETDADDSMAPYTIVARPLQGGGRYAVLNLYYLREHLLDTLRYMGFVSFNSEAFMITRDILYLLALQRDLKVEVFDLKAALESDKPVIFWHTTNGRTYCGYQLHNTDVTGGNVCFTRIPDLNPHKKIPKGLSDFYFVEWDGLIAGCVELWLDDTVRWLGDMELQRYQINLSIETKAIPNDSKGTI